MPVESDCITQPSKHPFFLSGPAHGEEAASEARTTSKHWKVATFRLNLASHFHDPQFFPVLISMPDCGMALTITLKKGGIVLPSGPKEQPSKKCSRAILNLDWMYKILTWSMSSQLSTRCGCSFLKLYDSILHYATALLCQSSPAGSFFVGAFCWHPGQCLLPHQLIDHLWERSLSSAKPTCRHLALSCTGSESKTCLSCDHGRLNTTTLTARYCENVWNPHVLLWY